MGTYSGVASGYSNLAGDATGDTGAFVGGGGDNSSIARFSTVGGGFGNTASGNLSTIGGGLLAIRKPWPAMMRGIWGDEQRYIDTYWSRWDGKYYFAGDAAYRDKDGYFWIVGRVDDVVNVSGHRIGTAELESAFIEHGAVIEAAVVGVPHEIKGEGLVGFVSLREGEQYSVELA